MVKTVDLEKAQLQQISQIEDEYAPKLESIDQETVARGGTLRDQLYHERMRVVSLTTEMERRDTPLAETVRDRGFSVLTARESLIVPRGFNTEDFISRSEVAKRASWIHKAVRKANRERNLRSG